MIKIFIFLIIAFNLNALTFEERQSKIFQLKEIIVSEELEAKNIEKQLEESYSVLTLTLTPTDVIDNLDDKLIVFYKSNTFRDRTYYYSDDTIRVILKSDLSRHIYGLIKLNDGDSLQECTSPLKKVCLVKNDLGEVISFRLTNGTDMLYEYKIENYKTGPMTISENTALHQNEFFYYVPNGVSFMDLAGKQYIKTQSDTDTGIVEVQ